MTNKNINSAAELKLAIQAKQFEHAIQRQLLKDELSIAFESQKPINIIKNILSEISSSSCLIDNMLGAVVGLVSGNVSKKIAVGTSHNVFRKVMGLVLQFCVTNLVAQHPGILKSFGQLIIEKIFHKTETS